MRKLIAVLGAAAMMSLATGLAGATEPAEAKRVTHWELSHAGASTGGDVYWGAGTYAYGHGRFSATRGIDKLCYWGDNGPIVVEEKCFTARPGRPVPFTFRVGTDWGIDRVHVGLWTAGQEHAVAWVTCTREGCEVGQPSTRR
ncbi:hypothetical protein NDR87_08795 [Nocardia sp. CDC159]|uniref:Secreted protein n=1 Tax=Nocardia pulmonis TaxID=2951408 RepID=A0A9X2E661_9NOCA|nr:MULTISPECIES: hypothetical protein [Nocardia]MCM6773565.1 hypothetical protein [Nocardia pulmonis]MCM6786452.1 hypothetical protein [Nocardia sp. CDC159]